jgi:four helix bundle protein
MNCFVISKTGLGTRDSGLGVGVMTELRSHKDLRVWQKAIELVTSVYHLTRHLPKTEQFGLISQLQRAAVSVPTNIAEGNSRGTRKDYARFVDIARGSASEIETLLIIVVNLGLASPDATVQVQALTSDVGRMLTGLAASLSKEGFNEEDQAEIA